MGGMSPNHWREPEAYAAWLYQSWSDREVVAALLEDVAELDARPDMDIEGHDVYETITVDRMALREVMRRTRTERTDG